jgi:hypothetical protein
MHLVAAELARKLKLLDGYRTVANSGPGAASPYSICTYIFLASVSLAGRRDDLSLLSENCLRG